MAVESHPDSITAEELLAEMAWLRRLARRIAGRDDAADDAVQETLLAALRRGPRTRGNLRGWLGAVLRNAVRKAAVRERRRDARERVWEAGRGSRELGKLGIDERFALEHDLSKAVLVLDESLRRVVLLRFLDELSLREIAAEVGAPISTVEARLGRALSILRWRLERSHGDDGAARPLAALWPLYLAEIRAAPRSACVPIAGATGSAAPWALRGALASAGALGIAAVALVLATSRDPAPRPTSEVERTSAATTDANALLEHGPPGGATSLAVAAAPVRNAAAPLTGGLELLVRDAAGGSVGLLLVAPWPEAGADPVPHTRRTNGDGGVAFSDLAPGVYALATDRSFAQRVVVRPGEVTRVALELVPRELAGLVVDAQALPVADAVVWVSAEPGGAFRAGAWERGVVEAEGAIHTDAAGRFALPGCGAVFLAGARAPGYAPSAPLRVAAAEDGGEPLRLVLPGAGGAVAGRVTGPEGAPISGAVVLIDPSGPSPDPTVPLVCARSDADGRFRVDGLPTGACALAVRAPGLPAWRGTVDVARADVARADVALVRGGVVRGAVRDRFGRPVAAAEVCCEPLDAQGETALLRSVRARTDEHGDFELAGVPTSEPLRLAASAPGIGRAAAEVVAASGPIRRVELVLSGGREIRGWVVDAGGGPLAHAAVVLATESGVGTVRARTDADGRLELAELPAGRLRLRVFEAGWVVFETELADEPGADAGPWPQTWIVPRATRPSAVLRGRVLGGGGSVLVRSVAHPAHAGLQVETGADGRFETDLLPPGELRLAWVGADGLQGLDPETLTLAAEERRDLGDCTVRPAGIVELHLDALGGGPLGELRATVRDAEGGIVLQTRFSGAAPERLALRGGAYTLLVWSATVAPLELPLRITDGETSAVYGTLAPGAPCELWIEAPNGPRLRALELRLETMDGTPVATFAVQPSLDARGVYRLEVGLAPGRYRLRGEAAGPRVEAELAVERGGAGDTQQFELRLR